MINISTKKAYKYDDLDSIDHVVGFLERSLPEQETINYNLLPEEEFWGHCSNLQGWFEYGYDTCFLHSNLAFPLLKKLYEAGDSLAKRVFKEEIAKRLGENYAPINELFIEDNYFSYLSEQEIETCCPKKLNVDRLILASRNLTDIPPLIDNLTIQGLKSLNLINNRFSTFPTFALSNRHLEVLLLQENQIKSIPESIEILTNLEILNLSVNKLKALPNNIGKLKSLKTLSLCDNNLITIPDSIGDLASLKELFLSNNKLRRLPMSIGKLTNLEHLSLCSNQLSGLPSSLTNLKNLKSLDLSNNTFQDVSTIEFSKILSLKVARNNANSMIQAAEQFLKDSNLITSDQRLKISQNIEKLREVIYSDDFNEIDDRTHNLSSY